ncbi:DUF1510 family protein [Alkalibacillus salilacus]|uniref:Cytoskeletal protein RodZ n=1 Tax=Alkalibacillus salilacus TaxID=284582 RepID=A0ABT9VCL6_9BACI|nr:DUF1510 family protein [Alkalibacillus salilacus]MDQ0158706.1 cytoskeletal protein RodZ [Alkalibacillus salilacus]
MDHSRSERFEKRRKNTRLMNVLIWTVILLIIVLIGFWFFGGDDSEEQQGDQTTDQSTESTEDNESNNENADGANESDESNETESNNEEEQGGQEGDENSDDSTEENSESNNEEDTESDSPEEPTDETVTESDKENVTRVIERDWEPIGTEQEEPHNSEFSEGTQDRAEMEDAIEYATGLSEDNIIFWRLESGGMANHVIGTVTDSNQEEVYRVYLDWIEGEGWQPQKIEELEVNDKHPDYDENSDETNEDTE